MADSDHESDFASAESDQEEPVAKGRAGASPERTASVEENVGPTETEESPTPVAKEGGSGREDPGASKEGEPAENRELKELKVTESEKCDSTSQQVEASGEEEKMSEEHGIGGSDKETGGGGGGGGEGGGGGGGGGEGGGRGEGAWGWGGWGSLWSSVSTVTESTAQALGQKVTSVIASVEDTLGLPPPEELAKEGEEEEEEEEVRRRLAEEIVEHDVPPEDQPILQEPHSQSITRSGTDEENRKERQREEEEEGEGEGKGEKEGGKELVSGGLDALETIGKKTMEVLSDGDPGLRKKRAIFAGREGPSLSQLLKEAKEEATTIAKRDEGDPDQQILNYTMLFDEYQGLVHLEALELLSKEYQTKVRTGLATLSGEELRSMRERLEEIADSFNIEELNEVLDDDSCQLGEVVELFADVTLPLKVDRLMMVSNSWREKIESLPLVAMASEQEEEVKKPSGEGEQEKEKAKEEEEEEEREVKMKDGQKQTIEKPSSAALHESGLRSLAELTSASIELFRKMAEVCLLSGGTKHNPLEQAAKFNKLTVLVSSELDALASVHAEALTALYDKESHSSITSLYLEASNSCSYVQDAFQLLSPVLQYTLLQGSLLHEPAANVLKRT